MFDVRKFFQSNTASTSTSDETELGAISSTGELRNEYVAVITDCLGRGGIPPNVVFVEPRVLGRADDGRPVILGMLRIVEWDRRAVVRLLLGYPLLEKNLKRLVHASWVAEVSAFAGLWLHASTAVQSTPIVEELRKLVLQLEEGGMEPGAQEVWKLPPAGDTNLGDLR